MIKYDFHRGCYLSSNGIIANVVLHDLDLYFQDQTFQVAILTVNAEKMQTLLLPSRESRIFATANAERHDLDLRFQGCEF